MVIYRIDCQHTLGFENWAARSISLQIERRDPVAVQAKVRHQTPIRENESDDRLLGGPGCHAGIGTHRQQGHRTIDTRRPSSAGFESAQYFLRHEEDEDRLRLRARE